MILSFPLIRNSAVSWTSSDHDADVSPKYKNFKKIKIFILLNLSTSHVNFSPDIWKFRGKIILVQFRRADFSVNQLVWMKVKNECIAQNKRTSIILQEKKIDFSKRWYNKTGLNWFSHQYSAFLGFQNGSALRLSSTLTHSKSGFLGQVRPRVGPLYNFAIIWSVHFCTPFWILVIKDIQRPYFTLIKRKDLLRITHKLGCYIILGLSSDIKCFLHAFLRMQ